MDTTFGLGSNQCQNWYIRLKTRLDKHIVTIKHLYETTHEVYISITAFDIE